MDLKKTMNTDYLGSWDFKKDETKILTIKDVVVKKVFNPNKSSEEETAIMYFTNHQCGMILNTTNKKTLIKLFQTSETDFYKGKNIALVTTEIKVRGEWIEAVRVAKELPKQQADAPKEKEVMDKNHKGWQLAIDSLKSKSVTVEQIKTKYKLSEQSEKELKSYEKV